MGVVLSEGEGGKPPGIACEPYAEALRSGTEGLVLWRTCCGGRRNVVGRVVKLGVPPGTLRLDGVEVGFGNGRCRVVVEPASGA